MNNRDNILQKAGLISTHQLRSDLEIQRFDWQSLKSRKFYTMSVVRNTYDRVLSMYFNRVLGIENGKPNYIKSNMSFNLFLQHLFDNTNSFINQDHHFQPQYLFDDSLFKVDKYIYLNEINEVLPKLYETKFSISQNKIKRILKECKENALPKNIYNTNGTKLDEYDFKRDALNLKISENGIPQKQLMLTDENINMIYSRYKGEIDFHKFEANL